jgi:NAD(P)-dependent dehydrogenase (short-subunit alcohol dehydrogenase family)
METHDMTDIELQLTRGGWELQFATNHLGHFALAHGLHAALAASGDARIVSLSSRGHLRSRVVFDDINFSDRPYDPWLAYGQSKTANVLFAVGATQRWAGEGIYANAVHPGAGHTDDVKPPGQAVEGEGSDVLAARADRGEVAVGAGDRRRE